MIEAENPSHGSSVNMTDHLFISASMHYYVAGRYAVYAGLNPTAANLLHHAIEMALKGALAKKGVELKALKRLSHDLPKIWREFTTQYGIDSSTFDGVIAELQKFETIRYPDEIVKQGLASLISPEAEPTVRTHEACSMARRDRRADGRGLHRRFDRP
jgi:hypothetical protein